MERELVLAKQVLSQLSYTPTVGVPFILKHLPPFPNPFLRFFIVCTGSGSKCVSEGIISNLQPLVPIVRECQGICEPKGRALRLEDSAWPDPVPISPRFVR